MHGHALMIVAHVHHRFPPDDVAVPACPVLIPLVELLTVGLSPAELEFYLTFEVSPPLVTNDHVQGKSLELRGDWHASVPELPLAGFVVRMLL